MEKYVLYFHEIDKSHLPYVGGKGANLGEMTLAGFPVPQGFCVTTRAYRAFIQASQKMAELLNLLDGLQPNQLEEIRQLGQRIRDHLLTLPVPETVKGAISDAWHNSGIDQEYAVRSSATAEDLPTASFAGQQDTYLNVKGAEQLLQAVRNCWASLFTDRSIVYRIQNGFDHRSVFLSVVVQRMIFPEVSGIMFTADPVTGNRRVVSIDASFGLGEALVSGIVSADLYQVKSDQLIKKQIARKEIAIYAKPEGGTAQVEIPEDRQTTQALADEQAVRLADLGRAIEKHFGNPQDIEWGLVENTIFILQCRPITTLYPVPSAPISPLLISSFPVSPAFGSPVPGSLFPVPSAQTPSVPAPSVPIPSAPAPTSAVSVPTAPTPSAPATSMPASSAPIPSVPAPSVPDTKLHLFLSLGHPQMMTDAIKPLGISVLRTLAPGSKSSPQTESGFLLEAGSRLYGDITQLLEYPQIRKRLPELLLNVDESLSRAVQEFSGREEFLASGQVGKKIRISLVRKALPTLFAILKNIIYRDNDQAIDEFNRFTAEQVERSRKQLQAVSGPARIAQIQNTVSTLLPTIFLKIVQYLSPAMLTYKIIAGLSRKWLGDATELRSLSKSPPGNVTTEMGLALGDLADAVRQYPAVIKYLEVAANSTFWQGLKSVPGGDKVFSPFQKFMDKYGMRGTGEIDLTRPRWRETPTQLVPAILSHIQNTRPGQQRLDFLSGKEEAELAAGRLVNRLRQQPLGFLRASLMQRLIKVHRSLIGIRESPKYFIVQHFDLIKRSLLQEAATLVTAGILEHPEDIFWLSLPEIKEVLISQNLDRSIIARRQEKFRQDEKLTPPRALTSEGEIISVKPGIQVPPGAFAGSPVSAGTVEGRARVILKLEDAKMEKGDILVTPYTDPAWTPLFPLAAALVTEVGGLMTHGAVVAREYGIPAVVGVDNATRVIKNGEQIRVDGTQGIVTILEPDDPSGPEK